MEVPKIQEFESSDGFDSEACFNAMFSYFQHVAQKANHKDDVDLECCKEALRILEIDDDSYFGEMLCAAFSAVKRAFAGE